MLANKKDASPKVDGSTDNDIRWMYSHMRLNRIRNKVIRNKVNKEKIASVKDKMRETRFR